MSQITAGHDHGNGASHAHGAQDAHGHAEAPYVAARRKLDLSRLVPGAGFARPVWAGLLFLGVVGLAVTLFGAFSTGPNGKTHALTAYHMGFLYVLGIALGSLGIVLIFQQFNAGWSASVRRQAETIASLMPIVLLLFIPVVVIEVGFTHGALFSWMNAEHTAGDPVFAAKSGYLNVSFWLVRAAIYFAIWIGLGAALYRLSRKQDQTGDRWLTARARWVSSFGLLLFALSTAFASFDWLMSLDYHWFSTMFGVYFFAGSVVCALSVLIMILVSLRASGRMGPCFTAEHQHDLGKLLLSFTIFWAYVTFCQYFLIWYSNIPEEAAFYNLRKDGGYMPLFVLLCFGHFLVPFLVLLFRDVKRSTLMLRLVAVWMLIMHGCDLFFMVRPIVKSVPVGEHIWIDVFGILGPVSLFLGLVVWKMGRAPLVPIKDPRLDELLAHKNYV